MQKYKKWSVSIISMAVANTIDMDRTKFFATDNKTEDEKEEEKTKYNNFMNFMTDIIVRYGQSVRNGTCSIFAFVEPLGGKHHVSVHKHRTAVDWAREIKYLADGMHPNAEKIILIIRIMCMEVRKMMNTNDNLQKIMLTLEQIRSEKYCHVSKEIVENIINIQFENQEKDSRHIGRATTHQVIRKYIEEQSQGAKKC